MEHNLTECGVGPVEESPEMRKVRLDAFLTFYGPGGFATPEGSARMR